MVETSTLVILAVVTLIVFLTLIFLCRFLALWIRALISNAPVSLFALVGLRLRKVPPGLIVNSRIKAVNAGLNITTNQLEAHYLAGGRVDEVVEALVGAKAASFSLTFEKACEVDLATKLTGKPFIDEMRSLFKRDQEDR